VLFILSVRSVQSEMSVGIPTPVVAAPMAGASGGALAAQTSAAGAFGFVGAGGDSLHSLRVACLNDVKGT